MNIQLASRWAAAATAALSLAGCGVNTGPGQANGYVTITKHTGFLCRTYEGEMALGNIRSVRASSGGNTLDFNVQDPAIFAQLQKAQNDQTPVHVEYHETFLPWWCTQANNEVIDKVTPMKDAIASPFGVHVGDEVGGTVAAPSGKGARERVILACDPICKVAAAPKG